MKNTIKKSYLILLNLFLIAVFLAPSVFAVEKPNPSKAAKNSIIRENRLTEAKLKVCQVKEKAMKKQIESLGKLAKNMLDKFDAIFGRVEKYYTEKVLPSGKTVSNYSILVADIQTKKEAVKTALDEAQSNVNSFSCTSSDPKGQLKQFKEDMKTVKSALKDHRTSIKNLIVAVHSITGITEKE